MKRRFIFSVLITLFATITAMAAEKTYTHTFGSGEITTAGGDVTLSGVKWTTSKATYIGFDATKGVQIGSGNKPQNEYAWTISTSAFNQEGITIKEVTLNLSVASSGGGTAAVSIGGKQFDDVITLGTGNVNPQDISFSNGSYASGDITISLLSTKAKAMYIKSIKVVYDEGEQSVGKPTFSPKAGTYYTPQSVSLSAGINASIYYTTDGSTPSASSTHYTAPFTVSTTTTVKAIAVEGDRSSEVSEATYTIAELPADAYMRVNNASELQEGDRLLFVAKYGDTYYAMGAQNQNNRAATELETANDVFAVPTEATEVFALGKEDLWFFRAVSDMKYLVANGGENQNYLKSITQWDNKCSASIVINKDATATIQFFYNTLDNYSSYLRFNINTGNSPIFSCYKTAENQQPVYIYRRPGEPVRDIPATPTFSLASGMYNEAQSTTVACETEGAVIHYTTDGTEPTAESPEYTSAIAFALDPDQAVRTTVKAIAVKKGVSSEMAVLKVTVNPFMYQYKAVKSEEGLVEGDTYIVLARDGEHAAGVVNESNYRIYAVAASADSYTFEGAVATLPQESPVAVYTLSGSEGAWVMTDKVGNLCLPNTDNTNVTYNRNATLHINFRDGMAQISGQDGRLLTYRDRSVSEDVNEQVFRNYSVKNSASKGYQTVRLYKVVTKREELNQYDLSDVLKAGTQGDVTISGFDLQGVATFTAGGANYLVVKDADDAQYLNAKPEENDKDFAVEGHNQMDYPQNNWLLVNMGEGSATEYVGKTLTTINGTLAYEGGVNPVMTNANIAVGEDAETYEPNVYCPVNFLGESSVTAGNPAQKGNYFFMQPKRCEFATITWAVYNALDGAFYVPQFEGGSNVNGHAFPGGFDVDWSMNAQGDVHERLRTDAAYRFSAVVMEAAAQSNTARRIEAGSTHKGTKYVVFPVNLDPDVVTGILDVAGAKEVKSVRYFNIMGVESAEPVDGVNIVVTTYTDGTSSSAKMLR